MIYYKYIGHDAHNIVSRSKENNIEDTTMDFSRYNTMEEHMQLLDESNSWRGHSKNNHKLAANL